MGCRGLARVDPYAECLAHLSTTDRAAYLAGLLPGADLDHRGTSLSEELLTSFSPGCTTLRQTGPAPAKSPSAAGPEFAGEARFDGWNSATKPGSTGQSSPLTPDSTAHSSRAPQGFGGTEFAGDAGFPRATFGRDAWFDGPTFHEQARFRWVEFGGDAEFNQAKFGLDARFNGARFGGDARFFGPRSHSNAHFNRAAFTRASVMGPFVCVGELVLSEAVFDDPAVTIEAATAGLVCRRTRWASTAALRLRYAGADLSDAVLEYPVSIAAQSWPFVVIDEDVAGHGLTDPRVRVHHCAALMPRIWCSPTSTSPTAASPGPATWGQSRLEGDASWPPPVRGTPARRVADALDAARDPGRRAALACRAGQRRGRLAPADGYV